MARKPKQEGYIDWRKSEAREVIVEGLKKGNIPLSESEMSTEEVWRRCRFLPAFVGPPQVIFKQFKERLKDHRKQYQKYNSRMEEEELGLAYDRTLFPRQPINHRGEPVFDMSPAKPLLTQDVRNNLHKLMSPALLRKSRAEYMVFSLEKFRQRIYQEERTQKYYHYLAVKRAKKQQEYHKRREAAKREEARKQQQEEQTKKRQRNY